MLAPKRQAVFLKESRDVDCSSASLEAATDNLSNVGQFRFVPIVLKKSFSGEERKF
jgi:hypothetical protein